MRDPAFAVFWFTLSMVGWVAVFTLLTLTLIAIRDVVRDWARSLIIDYSQPTSFNVHVYELEQMQLCDPIDYSRSPHPFASPKSQID